MNNQGDVTWKGKSEAFGKTVLDADNLIVMNLRFPGQYYDSETGNHYNYFRDYYPTIGRYQRRDPVELAGGINAYGYVEVNPLSYTDPQGLAIPFIYAAIFRIAFIGSAIYGVESWKASPYGSGNALNSGDGWGKPQYNKKSILDELAGPTGSPSSDPDDEVNCPPYIKILINRSKILNIIFNKQNDFDRRSNNIYGDHLDGHRVQ